MRRSLDMWRCAIVKRRAEDLSTSTLRAEDILWLPSAGRFAFRADPFGLWHDGLLHIFVERLDYRWLKGEIELLVYDKAFNLLRTQTVLKRPWHLSYPFVFEGEGAMWMLPEARRSGELTLYRAAEFPGRWEPAAVIENMAGTVDATPLRYAGKWWLFYARARGAAEDSGTLNIASADTLAGPWHPHPFNPIMRGPRCRPGGSPLVHGDGSIDIPLQDSSRTYGGSLRKLTITLLDEQRIQLSEAPWIEPVPALRPYTDGLHTLSAAGQVSLIDCKFLDRSLATRLSRVAGGRARRLRRWFGLEAAFRQD